jgi:hypothetical protein
MYNNVGRYQTEMNEEHSMKLGIFKMPAHPHHRSIRNGDFHDDDTWKYLDRIGFEEAWIGRYYMMPSESSIGPAY